MHNAVYAAFLLAAASTFGLAQAQAKRPASPAPAASASFEVREGWCVKYAAWFVSQTPTRERVPDDVRPTQRFENELTYCKLDPRQYERETLAELGVARPAARG